jgi:hypothetical protein
MRKDNKILVDLNKVQWARFGFVNQYGQWRDEIPKLTSIRCEPVYPDKPAHYHVQYPGETESQRAKRLGLLDVWNPQLTLKLTANEHLIYTGQKALTLWEVWKAKIYGKNN